MEYNKGSSVASNVWEAMKAYLRGIYIKGISIVKSWSRALMSALRSRLDETEQRYLQAPTPDYRLHWLEEHKLLDAHLLEQAGHRRLFTK